MADILNLRCDAWLLPTDSMITTERHWARAHPDLRTAAASASSEFRSDSSLAEAVHPWDPAAPLPILTAVPDDGTWGPSVAAERLTQALAGKGVTRLN